MSTDSTIWARVGEGDDDVPVEPSQVVPAPMHRGLQQQGQIVQGEVIEDSSQESIYFHDISSAPSKQGLRFDTGT